MQLFDGNFHAHTLDEKIMLCAKKRFHLSIIYFDKSETQLRYISLKTKLCQKLGIDHSVICLESTSEDSKLASELLEIVNSATSGILIQLPLPKKELSFLLDLIPTEKDPDFLSLRCQDAFYYGDFSKLPPVVRAFDYYVKQIPLNLSNATVGVLGNGFLVGKPVSYYCKQLGATVTTIEDYKTGEKLTYDLVVLSAGIPNLVNPGDLNPGCNVVDFG
jgi:5,10-methylene-tetrahydrofolate dehydrogenase/methenyl tetrahydrofolate cyclohydrolase